MKKIGKNKITHIKNTDVFDSILLFNIVLWSAQQNIEVIFLSDLLEKKKNIEMLEKSQIKPASYGNVYSPKDELDFFEELCQTALSTNTKVHIVGITLDAEVQILEKYYMEMGFFNDEINCFEVDFSKVLISASVKIENIQWRGSDYKKMGEKIFFNPPVRESGQVKAMFKGINRGVIAGLYLGKKNILQEEIQHFLSNQILEEKILSITLGKVLKYNIDDIGIIGENIEMKITY